MAEKAKHAFGTLENIDQALSDGIIDSYDILFVKDANGKPYVGWIDKEGQKVICDDSAEFAELEAEISTKANAEEVNTKINEATQSANAYTDKMVEAAMEEHLTKKYEVVNAPAGTLVDYRESEIRIFCPESTVWVKQAVGTGGDPNCYYATFRCYAPSDDAVGYIEHFGNQVDTEIQTTFSKDEYGRRFQTTWLALARYDESTGEWTYYGKNSTKERYIGWDCQLDWFNADGVMIASDCIRIGLSNEHCHSSIEPYYVGSMKKEIATMVDEKIAEATVVEVVEF